MPESNQAVGRISRRGFLRTVALAGAFTAAPLLARSTSQSQAPALTTPGQQAIKVGVLLPGSHLYPALDQSFLSGMQYGFVQAERAGTRPVQLVTEQYGISPTAAIKQGQKLLIEDQVDLLTGFVSVNEAAALEPLLRERRTLMVVSDLGANVQSRRRASPLIFRSSFGYWQANLALGTWAGNQLGQRAVIASSFYDSGYDTAYAFQSGFESAGGTIAGLQFTHHPGYTRDLSQALDSIATLKPDVVYAAYSGQRAVDFLRAYSASGLAGRVPLIGPGFLTDERLLPEAGIAAHGVRTSLAWAYDLALPHNQSFISAYTAQTGRTADPFAVLGHDTAQLITSALTAIGGNMSDTAGLQSALSGITIVGARGKITMDSAERETVSALYLREVRTNGTGLHNRVVAELDTIPTNDARVGPRRNELRSGWANTYLCV